MSDDRKEGPMGQVIQIDEARIQDHLGEMVRGTVEETLNALLDRGGGSLVRSRQPRCGRSATNSRLFTLRRTAKRRRPRPMPWSRSCALKSSARLPT